MIHYLNSQPWFAINVFLLLVDKFSRRRVVIADVASIYQGIAHGLQTAYQVIVVKWALPVGHDAGERNQLASLLVPPLRRLVHLLNPCLALPLFLSITYL